MKLESYSFNIFQSSEVTHLISCQPTALKAVRLQSLVPPNPDKIYIRDLLVKNEVRIHLFYFEEYHEMQTLYELLTTREVKMAGYWPSSFFVYVYGLRQS